MSNSEALDLEATSIDEDDDDIEKNDLESDSESEDETDLNLEPEFENETLGQRDMRFVFNTLEGISTSDLVLCFSSDATITQYEDYNSDKEEVPEILAGARELFNEAFDSLSWTETATSYLEALVPWAEWVRLNDGARKHSRFDIETFCKLEWFYEGFSAFREVANFVQLNLYGVCLTTNVIGEEPSRRGRDILTACDAQDKHAAKYDGASDSDDDESEPEPSLELFGPQEALGVSLMTVTGKTKSQRVHSDGILPTPTIPQSFLHSRIESNDLPSSAHITDDDDPITDVGVNYITWRGRDLKAECIKRHIVWRLLTNAQMANLLANDDNDPDSVPKNARTAKDADNGAAETQEIERQTPYNVDPETLAQKDYKYLRLRVGKLKPLLQRYKLRCTNLKNWQYIQSVLDHSQEARADLDLLLADV